MSEKHPPIVPAGFIIGAQRTPYVLAPIVRLELLYHTPLTVRGRGTSVVSKPQQAVYCLPDEAAWERVQATHAAFTAAMAALGAELTRLGSYSARLAEAGGPKQAPNPLSPKRVARPGGERRRGLPPDLPGAAGARPGYAGRS